MSSEPAHAEIIKDLVKEDTPGTTKPVKARKATVENDSDDSNSDDGDFDGDDKGDDDKDQGDDDRQSGSGGTEGGSDDDKMSVDDAPARMTRSKSRHEPPKPTPAVLPKKSGRNDGMMILTGSQKVCIRFEYIHHRHF